MARETGTKVRLVLRWNFILYLRQSVRRGRSRVNTEPVIHCELCAVFRRSRLERKTEFKRIRQQKLISPDFFDPLAARKLASFANIMIYIYTVHKMHSTHKNFLFRCCCVVIYAFLYSEREAVSYSGIRNFFEWKGIKDMKEYNLGYKEMGE